MTESPATTERNPDRAAAEPPPSIDIASAPFPPPWWPGAVISPDGTHWWDGQRWRVVTTADGRFWWDGWGWQPCRFDQPGAIVSLRLLPEVMWLAAAASALSSAYSAGADTVLTRLTAPLRAVPIIRSTRVALSLTVLQAVAVGGLAIRAGHVALVQPGPTGNVIDIGPAVTGFLSLMFAMSVVVRCRAVSRHPTRRGWGGLALSETTMAVIMACWIQSGFMISGGWIGTALAACAFISLLATMPAATSPEDRPQIWDLLMPLIGAGAG